MGHLLTPQGLRPDPEKIQAILQMPEPKDVTALKRFLGMVTYLAKFMPHLSEMTGPVRRLEDKDMEFKWLPQHSLAMDTIKKFLTEAPVLRYYDVSKQITVQCDASQFSSVQFIFAISIICIYIYINIQIMKFEIKWRGSS